jgi:hypothetical protein
MELVTTALKAAKAICEEGSSAPHVIDVDVKEELSSSEFANRILFCVGLARLFEVSPRLNLSTLL